MSYWVGSVMLGVLCWVCLVMSCGTCFDCSYISYIQSIAIHPVLFEVTCYVKQISSPLYLPDVCEGRPSCDILRQPACYVSVCETLLILTHLVFHAMCGLSYH